MSINNDATKNPAQEGGSCAGLLYTNESNLSIVCYSIVIYFDFGSGSRTFYVGKDLTQEDIKAKFEDGVLKLTVPKIEKKPEEPKSKYITIE